MAYIPDRGDLVWIVLSLPQAGNEPVERRPALVLSPAAYNEKTGWAILCAVTRQISGYPFEVLLPEGLRLRGAVLSDQVMSLDWKLRHAERIAALPKAVLDEVLQKLEAILF
jgi:mRNA interferase MazF